ncbi:hypothetical protein [[Phormidium ambiguum] IAM M-71]|uniref:hypothetical protein n=1 Tax=[Phormidium ambiguum] IAM M-71 TaxID=454136 RepID=UPI001160EADB|nr:hypothetical protein [Phormidium ambiguum]
MVTCTFRHNLTSVICSSHSQQFDSRVNLVRYEGKSVRNTIATISLNNIRQVRSRTVGDRTLTTAINPQLDAVPSILPG